MSAMASPELAGHNKVSTIGRATYALRRSDYLGGIFTHTNYNGRDNVVAGGDFSFKPSSAQSVNATFLSSRTTDRGTPDAQGNAVQMMLRVRDAQNHVWRPARTLRPRLPDGHRVL